MEIIGKPTIQPGLFYSGKLAGLYTWLLMMLALFRIIPSSGGHLVAWVFFLAGSGFLLMASISLGKSTKVGLPSGDTQLKTAGVYQYSRNPMYVGVHLFTLAAIILRPDLLTIAAGIYSMVVHHFIIQSEEKFLAKRFGAPYLEYMGKVRRYL
jgi:protein-S-isoprenylcysteine O-methyltransferase Ste14